MTSYAEEVTCPVLNCNQDDINSPLFSQIDICYDHDLETPTKTFNTYSCDQHQFAGYTEFTPDATLICDFNLMSGEYAWFDEEKPNDSQLYKKRV